MPGGKPISLRKSLHCAAQGIIHEIDNVIIRVAPCLALAPAGLLRPIHCQVSFPQLQGPYMHFCLSPTGREALLKKWWIYVLIYLPGIVLTYGATTTNFTVDYFVWTYWGWNWVPPSKTLPKLVLGDPQLFEDLLPHMLRNLFVDRMADPGAQHFPIRQHLFVVPVIGVSYHSPAVLIINNRGFGIIGRTPQESSGRAGRRLPRGPFSSC